MISQATIDEIRSKMDIVEVVQDFVTLKRSGSSYRALSPFANEKTPSFYVVPSRGIFKDFSSGKGGDAITFIMEMDGLSYVEALRYLAKKYSIEIVEDKATSPEALLEQNKRESLYIVLNYAKKYFKDLLHTTEEGQSIGLSYFRERGFTDATIENFELGYSLHEWDSMLKKSIADGYNPALLEEAGLVITKEGKTYDRFRNRVIFPIHNTSGKVVAFGARIMTADKKQPKYINSPETELYSKSKTLYGLFQARQPIRQENNCFLAEGYTDVISMHQAGVKNVVSSSGTALTTEQVKLIRQYTENVTVIYDGDPAGLKASIRGIDLLLEGGLNVRAVVLPKGEDPDSYVKSLGSTAFSHFIKTTSQDFIRFKTRLFLDEAAGDPVKKAELIREIVQSISKIDDPIKRTVYLEECSTLLNMDEQVLISELNKILITRFKQKKEAPQEPDAPPPVEERLPQVAAQEQAVQLQEQESIRVLMSYGKIKIFTKGKGDQQEIVTYYLNELEQIEFSTPVYRKILETIKAKLREGVIVDAAYFLENGSEEVKKAVGSLMVNKYEVSENWKNKYKIHIPHETEILGDVTYSNILRLKFRVVQHLIAEKSKKLKTATTDKETDSILDDLAHYKSIEVSIARILGNVTVK